MILSIPIQRSHKGKRCLQRGSRFNAGNGHDLPEILVENLMEPLTEMESAQRLTPRARANEFNINPVVVCTLFPPGVQVSLAGYESWGDLRRTFDAEVAYTNGAPETLQHLRSL